jgi:hypothetical protein
MAGDRPDLVQAVGRIKQRRGLELLEALNWAARPGGLRVFTRQEVQGRLKLSESRVLELFNEGRFRSARQVRALGWVVFSCCVDAEQEGDLCERHPPAEGAFDALESE